MQRTAERALEDVDVVCWVADAAARSMDADGAGLDRLRGSAVPVYCCLNKIDLVTSKSRLLPVDQRISGALSLRRDHPDLRGARHQLRSSPRPAPRSHARTARVLSRRHPHRPAGDLLRRGGNPRADLSPDPPGNPLRVRGTRERARRAQAAGMPLHSRRGSSSSTIPRRASSSARAAPCSSGSAPSARENLERFFGIKVYLELTVQVRRNWRRDDKALKEFGFLLTS